MKPIIILLVLAVAAILAAGCTAQEAYNYYTTNPLRVAITDLFNRGQGLPDAQVPTPVPTPVPMPELHGHIEWGEKWSLGLGCYDQVEGYVYNSGNAPSYQASILLKLIDKRTGKIRDTENVYLGKISPGESIDFENTLDGDCDHEYTVEGVISP